MRDMESDYGSLKELAHRENDGFEVALLWNDHDDRLSVSVRDARTGELFELEAARDKALDVFYHPYSYARARTLLYADPPGRVSQVDRPRRG